LGVRLFFLQVVKSQYYRDQADRQYLRPTGAFNRGNIYFTAKDGTLVAAATMREGYTIALNPKRLLSATTTYERLAGVFTQAGLSLDREQFLAKAARVNDPYEEIAVRTEKLLADRAADLPGNEIIVSKDRWRYYPAATSAAHVLGLLGYRGDDYAGRYGLEKTYNDVLSRERDQSFATFFAEIYRGLAPTVATGTSRAEGDIVLTIEPTVQKFLESALAKTDEKYAPELAGGIVIDPRTGDILAMAARPGFNPGEKIGDLSVLPNPLVEGRYELGSIVKALTMAAGLDGKAVTAKTTYDDRGCQTLNKKLFCNYDGKARGRVNMQEVLNQSLNLGVTFVEQQLGKEKFRAYFQNFGLGERTGIDLPGEVAGSLSTLDNDQDVEFATASFGQGISITPIAMSRALTALANNGRPVKPRLVREIRYSTGLNKVIPPVIGAQVIATSTAREISRMLTEVVDTKLANGKAKLPHTTVAAKTGTAQYVDPATRQYYPDRYLHSFFGYFPAYEPRFLIFLMVKHPRGVQYASETLTEPFLDLTKFLLSYYQVPPDR
jgi:cell division protein FtsI/penicillin-binding protein 2